MIDDANLAANPFAFRQHDVADLPPFDKPSEVSSTVEPLRSLPSWIILCATCNIATLAIMSTVITMVGLANSRIGTGTFAAWFVAAGMVLLLVGYCWPGFWLFETTSRIRRAGEEQTLSAIADVLEAQRSYWRALGVLVLLAIATTVISATYPF